MKDLYKCSLDELLTERQNAIENDDLDTYNECNSLINFMYNSVFRVDRCEGAETHEI